MSDACEEDSKVAQDFIAALERLQLSTPTNEELQARLRAGKLRINLASVALEAGHARRLISHAADCPYPNTRAKILEAVTGDSEKRPETLRQEIARLRNENSEQKDKIAIMATVNAELLIRFNLAADGYEPNGRPIRRSTKLARLKALNVVGKKHNRTDGAS